MSCKASFPRATQLTALAMVVAFGSTLLPPTSAHAYNASTHSRIAELAVRAMFADQVDDVDLVVPPGEAAEFAVYLAELRAAPARLLFMRTGLPTSREASQVTPFPLGGSDDPYPYAAIGTGKCDLRHPELLDLNRVGELRIMDLVYFPERTAEPCGLSLPEDPPDPMSENVPGTRRVLERVLGWQALSIDDHVNDVVIWVKPSNTGISRMLLDLGSEIFVLGLGAIALPFVCLFDAIFGDGCDVDHSFELARQADPSEIIEGLLPGMGDIRDGKFTGLWHFEHIGGAGHHQNDTRGMLYPFAGPSSSPGAVDVAISAGAEMVGLSLNALASTGVDQYGQYDQRTRSWPRWQARSIGSLEFSPVHNLARYGWDAAQRQGFSNAGALAWPLHALGDVSEPQHVAGTTAWGHRPYEEMVEKNRDKYLPPPGALERKQLARVIVAGFRWWKQLRSSNDIAAVVHDLAAQTRAKLTAKGDWAYQDDTSTIYQFDDEDRARAVLEARILPAHDADVQGLLEDSMGATLAMLTVASTRVQNPAPVNINCPAGQTFGPKTKTITGGAHNSVTREVEYLTCRVEPARPPVPNIDLRDAGIFSAQPPVSPPDAGQDGGSCTLSCDGDNECGEGRFCSDGCCALVH